MRINASCKLHELAENSNSQGRTRNETSADQEFPQSDNSVLGTGNKKSSLASFPSSYFNAHSEVQAAKLWKETCPLWKHAKALSRSDSCTLQGPDVQQVAVCLRAFEINWRSAIAWEMQAEAC